MCGPVLPILGAVAGAAGSFYSGMAQGAAYDAEAKGLRYQAEAELDAGAYEQGAQTRQNERVTGQQVAAIGSSGVDIWGTPMDVIQDSRAEGELDRLAIGRNAVARSNITRYRGDIAKMNAGLARTGGMIGAIAPMVQGFTGLQTSFA
jgi:hypothetical protein